MPRRGSEATRFGTLFHAGLECWWLHRAMPEEQLLDTVMRTINAHYAEYENQDPFELVRAEELMLGYHARWYDAGDYDTLGAEIEWQLHLYNPATQGRSRLYQLRGKADALVQSRESRRVFLVEHKTSTADITPGSEYWRRLRLDGQISMYYDGMEETARTLGKLAPDDPTPIAGCVYDVSRRPTLKPYKATPVEQRKYTQVKLCKAHKGNDVAAAALAAGFSPMTDAEAPCADCQPSRLYANQRDTDETVDEYRERLRGEIAAEPELYFQRGIVVRFEREMEEHRTDLWYQAGMMRDMVKANTHPRNVDACVQYNRTCDYFDVCTGVQSIDDDGDFTDSEAHPELSKSA